MPDKLDESSRRIAERGRDALLARLRPAFRDAAKAHADVLSLDDEQIEQMVQRAAERADGLQWRRALAGVATEELGIGLGEALSHPAVERAQAIIGAPSYEDSLAALERAATQEPAAADAPQAAPDAVASGDAKQAQQANEGEAAAAGHGGAGGDAKAEGGAKAAGDAKVGGDAKAAGRGKATGDAKATRDGEAREEGAQGGEQSQPPSLRLAAVHLGGIANLGPAEQGIELRLSEAGLDLARGGSALGRLRWPEIRTLDVPPSRGLRRRRRGGGQLVIRTEHGDASFEVPALSNEELEARLAPLRRRYAGHR